MRLLAPAKDFASPARLFRYVSRCGWWAGTAVLISFALPSHGQPTLQEALDDPEMTWTTGGIIPWKAQTNVTHDGISGATTGKHYAWTEPSWLETTVAGPGTLSFWWKVSSETNGAYYSAYLEFLIDGVRQPPRISGEIDWCKETLAVAPGLHKLRWQFPQALVGDYEYGWLDQVEFLHTEGPPAFVLQPKSQTNYVEGSARFEAMVSGSRPITYQWQLNGTNLPGATNAVLSLATTVPENAGSYRLLATNSLGSATSSNGILSLLPALLHVQPASQTVPTGSVVSFSVAITSPPGTALRWYRDGAVIVAGFITSITLPNVSFGDAGIYSVVISNQYGMVTSSDALLNVVPRVELIRRGHWRCDAQDVEVLGNYAMVATNGANGRGFAVCDISDATQPRPVGGWRDYATGLRMLGHYAYTFGPSIYDLSDPARARLTESFYFSYPPNDLVIVDRKAFFSLSTRGLFVWDLKKPTYPTSVPVSDPCCVPSFPGTIGVFAVPPFAYMVESPGYNYPGTGLAILDMSQPSNTVVLGRASIPDAVQVIVSGAWAYVVTRTNGLQVVDVANPATPRVVGWVGAFANGTGLAVCGSHVFVAASTLQAIDVSTPTVPGIVGGFGIGDARKVQSVGRYLYVAARDGLHILENSSAANSRPVIRDSPIPTKAVLDGTATMSVGALGDPPLSYQWRFNGVELNQATNFALKLTSMKAEMFGAYSVAVSNLHGSVTSAPAMLELTPPTRIFTEGTNRPVFVGNQMTFAFKSETNETYIIESADELKSIWQRNQVITGNGDVMRVTPWHWSSAKQFYRVRVP